VKRGLAKGTADVSHLDAAEVVELLEEQPSREHAEQDPKHLHDGHDDERRELRGSARPPPAIAISAFTRRSIMAIHWTDWAATIRVALGGGERAASTQEEPRRNAPCGAPC